MKIHELSSGLCGCAQQRHRRERDMALGDKDREVLTRMRG